MTADRLPEPAGTPRARPPAEEPATRTYCLIPPELDRLEADLGRAGRPDPGGELIVDRRRTERRRGPDRRQDPSPVPPGPERRLILNGSGRRVGDRRGELLAVTPLALPAPASEARLQLAEVRHRTRRELDDHEALRLVVRFQSGDPTAFEALYKRFFDRICTYLHIALRDLHEAEDATQEVLIRALRALPRYEFRGPPFEAWLFRIVRNYALDHKDRRDPVSVEDPRLIDRRRELAAAAGAADPLDWMSDDDLLLFIERLPVAQRQVIVMRFMLGLDWDEVAAVLGRSSGAVRQLEQRAFDFLRARFLALGRKPSVARRRMQMRRLGRPDPVVRARRRALLHFASP